MTLRARHRLTLVGILLLGPSSGNAAPASRVPPVPPRAGTPAPLDRTASSRRDGRNRAAIEQEATTRYQRGTAAYQKGDYEAALRHFHAAADLSYKPSLSYNLSLCYEKLKQPVDAVIHLRRYLASKPPPAWSKLANERLRYLLEVAEVPVQITSYPAGAAIYLGDRSTGLRGRTPFDLKLKPGSYRIFVDAGGYLPASREVQVDIGKPNYFDFQLKRQSSLHISASVAGAKVALDQEDEKQATLAPITRVVSPGRHRVRVSREEHRTVEREVDVNPGDQVSLFVDLPRLPRYGMLRVECNVPGATVQVEEEDVGETPLANHRLQVGTYRVFVRKENYQAWDQRVTISHKQITLARVQLTPKTSRRQMGWLIAGASSTGLLLSAGLIMTLTAANSRNEYEDLPRAELRRDGRRMALAADVLFGIGAFMGVVTGFVTWRLAPSKPLGTVVPVVGPDVVGVSYGGTF